MGFIKVDESNLRKSMFYFFKAGGKDEALEMIVVREVDAGAEVSIQLQLYIWTD